MQPYNINTDPWVVAEPESPVYGGGAYPLQKETYEVIGVCMAVHKELGYGFKEAVYKDALEQEFRWKNISYEREKKYEINYKGIILPHHYFADFVVTGNIILEVKAQQGIVDEHYCQVINYLAASQCPVGLLVNFGERSLRYKRMVLTK